MVKGLRRDLNCKLSDRATPNKIALAVGGTVLSFDEIIRRDRESNGRFGGGVCFFVRSNISYSLRSDLSITNLKIFV